MAAATASALPPELDFALDPSATPARMNVASSYLVSRFRALESITPDYVAAIDQIQQVGLDRLSSTLIPLFNQATQDAATIQALADQWTATNLPAQMEATVLSELQDGAPAAMNTLGKMAATIEAYRAKYLGSHDSPPTLDDNGAPVVVGAMYYDTTLDKMQVLGVAGWKNAGSVVSTTLTRQAYTATGGETTIAVAGGYDPGSIVVAKNGLTLLPTDVDVTSGLNIVLTAALSPGDVVSWSKFTAITVSNTYTRADTNSLLALKADAASVYTQSQITSILASYALASSVYTQAQVNTMLSAYALTANVYDRSATDQRYAPKTSPALTGTPTAPTPVTSDSSQSIATTAFVKAALAAGTAANANHASSADNATNAGFATNAGHASSADNATNAGHASSADVAGALSGLSSSLGTSGYATLPGGLIVQWGVYDSGSDSGWGNGVWQQVNFPMPFPGSLFTVTATPWDSGTYSSPANSIEIVGWPNNNNATFRTVGYQSGSAHAIRGFHWIAFGR